MMKKYDVTGMSCAACVNRVEKAVQKVPGVKSCSVSLLTNSLAVEGEAGEKEIIAAVEMAGYQAARKGENTIAGDSGKKDFKGNLKGNSDGYLEGELEGKEIAMQRRRLAANIIFLFVLMYFAMGHMIPWLKLPELFEENAVSLGILELILSLIVMVIDQKFFINGFKSAIHLAPNMDTLVALGSAVSFLYSTVILFRMTSVQMTDGIMAAHSMMNDLYFESAAMILVFISIGKTLEARAKGKTTDALKSLMQLAPKTATVVRNGEEAVVAIEKVRIDDIFVVKPGESIPVDGVVLEGNSAVNESSLTGESIPADKTEGDEVSAATINQSGYLKCRAIRVGKDTALSKIIEMVSDAAATKAPIEKIADKAAGIFVPLVLAISFLTFLVWSLLGENVGTALTFASSVLVISCPCSLGLATPVAIMVGNGVGAKNGILFKTAAALEGTGRIQIAALDKTGTITKGEPQVTDICPVNGIDERDLLQIAYALEAKSEHPLAKAIIKRAMEEKIPALETKESEVIPGKGIKAKWENSCICGGNEILIKGITNISPEMKERARALSGEGKTPLYFAKDDQFLGMIAVADQIKEDAKEAISELKNMGIQVVMITGDNARTAKAIADQAGIDYVVSGVLPGEKEEVIKKLKTFGKVVMAGDGINDAPALTRADIGAAIGSGTDIAIDAADVVLMKEELRDIPAMIRLGRAVLRNIHENLFWAFFYNLAGIPIAAGVLASGFGLRLNPMIGALAMSLSSVCVVTNALRLNTVQIYDGKKDRKRRKEISSALFADYFNNQKDKEKTEMKKTMKITGMMCPHCEARVKDVLESIDGVEEALVSHVSGTAVVTLCKDVSDEVLRTAVEKEKYPVTGIEKM